MNNSQIGTLLFVLIVCSIISLALVLKEIGWKTCESKRKNEALIADVNKASSHTSSRKKFQRDSKEISELLPVIYAITPTYARMVQKADLTRLAQTLMNVANLHWIVIEDSLEKSRLVSNLLHKSKLSYTHLNTPTPSEWNVAQPKYGRKKGVAQRNAGLDWLRRTFQSVPNAKGVIYFMDDDNTYDLKVFEEMRHISFIGVWPVAFSGGVLLERPKVNANGKVIGWIVGYFESRPFAIDMAGFAVNLKIFLATPTAHFTYTIGEGLQETFFLQHFTNSTLDLEPRAQNCTKVNVWHTKTAHPNIAQEKKFRNGSNFKFEI